MSTEGVTAPEREKSNRHVGCCVLYYAPSELPLAKYVRYLPWDDPFVGSLAKIGT